ncbi:unnamed protein product [Symbiodinium natans]|uniref:Reverse transcriptase Ty1/copia-type domain-containing protein n=1 Tax=Symbiodinium natans TaxID=878477 RepID=A0A812NCQ7_9DINO|nr:unnamed protein product [Symbiodinium natans]
MKDPVVPLKLALYGHPDSGGIWERHCETELKKVGFEPVLTDIWKSVFYNADLELLMVIYVDDFKLAGPTKNIQKGWESIACLGYLWGIIDEEPNPSRLWNGSDATRTQPDDSTFFKLLDREP